MVPSSTIAITTDGEHLTCGGFSLDETVCLRNFEFIVDYFGSLILSPRRGDEGVAFMGSTHSGISNPRWAMIEDSTEEFLMASSEKEASTSLTSEGATRGPCSLPPQPHHGWRMLRPHRPRRCFPRGRRRRGRRPTPPSSDTTLIMKGSRRKPVLGIPPPSRGRRHDEASSLASRPLPRFNHTPHVDTSIRSRRKGS
jgi:hypothetical protein